MMTVSICAYNMAAADLLALAVAADELGFEALWLGEHILLPVGYASDHPTDDASTDEHHITGPIVDPNTRLLDPWVQLAATAAATKRLRLATGIYILPLRHPLLTARAAATLHEVSGGRFLLGVGSGWLQEEFDALGVPFSERGRRFDETVEVLRRAWAGGPFDYQGSIFSFGPLQVASSRVDVPIIFGGNTPRALRRAALMGDGWFSSGTPTFDAALKLRDAIHDVRESHGKTSPFRCYFRVEGFDPAAIQRLQREGIDDVVIWADQLWPPVGDRRAALAEAADALGLVSPAGR
jgi:probable F420-dependent oxidoreductase